MSRPRRALSAPARRRAEVLVATSLTLLLAASTAARADLAGPAAAPSAGSTSTGLPERPAPALGGTAGPALAPATGPAPTTVPADQSPAGGPDGKALADEPPSLSAATAGTCALVSGLPVCSHDHGPATSAAARGSAPAPRTPLACEGDGRNGNRFRVLYVRRSDRPDRLGAVLADLRRHVEVANGVVSRSSGGARQLRVVTDAGCQASVATVVLSPQQTASFAETARAVRATGHSRIDRKYVLFVDDDRGCGMGEQYADDRADLRNRNNDGDLFAAVYPRCWDGVTLAHELVHTLGAVQASAPHSTGAHGHCTDGADVMCYGDGSGKRVSARCPASSAALLDCGRDDYFAVAPPAGSYLSQRWNTARSSFLVGGGPPIPLAPSAPRSVGGGTSGQAMTVRWEAPEQVRSGVGAYVVVDLARSSQALGQVPGTARTATVTLEPWRSYRLAVVAQNAAGSSPPAGDLSVTVGAAPAAPSGLLATYTVSGADVQAQLTWAGTAHAEGYRVLRDGRPVGDSRGTAWVDRSPAPLGRTVTYTVQAYNRWGSSPSSAAATAVTA